MKIENWDKIKPPRIGDRVRLQEWEHIQEEWIGVEGVVKDVWRNESHGRFVDLDEVYRERLDFYDRNARLRVSHLEVIG